MVDLHHEAVYGFLLVYHVFYEGMYLAVGEGVELYGEGVRAVGVGGVVL